MRLYQLHVCTKFQGNRTINTLTVAVKPPKMAQNDSYDVITSRRRCVIKISTPSRHAPMPPLYPVQVSRRSTERSRSLSCCKKGGPGRGVGSSNGLSRNGHFRPLLAPWGRGVESPGKFFWLNPITLVPATLPNHKIADKQLCLNLNPGTCVKVIVLWLRLVFGDWWV